MCTPAVVPPGSQLTGSNGEQSQWRLSLSLLAIVQAFCRQYVREQWNEMLRQELPGLTDDDITWLSTMAGYTPLPAVAGGGKRRRANQSESAQL